MIRADDEQDVFAAGIEPGHSFGDLAHIFVGAADRRAMRRRAQRRVVAGVVGLRQPQQGQSRGALTQNLGAEAFGNGGVAGVALGDREPLVGRQ